MPGYMYIAGASCCHGGCARGHGQRLDNDPHPYTPPFTWGICRPDLRGNSRPGYHIFFVSPKRRGMLQSIFAHMAIEEIITHDAAYVRFPNKRMRQAIPNGNIIVDGNGRYNAFDRGAHRANFARIRGHYAVGNEQSRVIPAQEYNQMAPGFLQLLERVFPGVHGGRAYDYIFRSGRRLDDAQVGIVLQWINRHRRGNE